MDALSCFGRICELTPPSCYGVPFLCNAIWILSWGSAPGLLLLPSSLYIHCVHRFTTLWGIVKLWFKLVSRLSRQPMAYAVKYSVSRCLAVCVCVLLYNPVTLCCCNHRDFMLNNDSPTRYTRELVDKKVGFFLTLAAQDWYMNKTSYK
jgi:hypothetical protein